MIGEFLNRVTTALEMHGIPYMLGESDRQIVDAAGIIEVQGAALDTAYIEKWVESLDLRAQWTAAREKA